MALSYQPSWEEPSLFPPTAGEVRVWQVGLPESPHGAYWTLNSSGCHSAAAVSLSSVLQTEASIPPKYYLSAKACQGILRRAEKRGKALPPILEQALTLRSMHGTANGDGQVVNTMAGDHQNRVIDYTAIVLRNREGKPGGGKGPLLSAERSLTLGTANDQVVFPAYRMVAFGEYTEDGTASALKARDYKDATDLTIGQIGIPRRLTPTECERLMGWEDGWTAHGIDERGREYALSDTPRYKLCGNGIASPVVQWIGMRLKMVLDSIAATQ